MGTNPVSGCGSVSCWFRISAKSSAGFMSGLRRSPSPEATSLDPSDGGVRPVDVDAIIEFVTRRRTSGIQPPGPPDSAVAGPFEVVRHYVDSYAAEFKRTRSKVKRRARNATIASISLTGLITVVGAADAAFNGSLFGVTTATLGALAAVVAAWDRLFKHREHWIQKTPVLAQLQELQRDMALKQAKHPGDADRFADEALQRLDAILKADVDTWMQLRGLTEAQGNAALTQATLTAPAQAIEPQGAPNPS